MSCKTVKKLLYLKRTELSAAEQKRLDKHLESCAVCRLIQDDLEKQAQIVGAITQPPILDQPEMLTNDILRSIRNIVKFSRSRSRPFDKLLDLFALKPVRFGFVTCCLLFLGFFSFQEMMVLRRVEQLESRLTQHSASALAAQFTSSPKNVLSLLDKKENQIVIDKEVLDEFLRSYGELQMKNQLLLKALEEQAEQSNITWQDGLTDDELRSLLKSKRIQRKIKEL